MKRLDQEDAVYLNGYVPLVYDDEFGFSDEEYTQRDSLITGFDFNSLLVKPLVLTYESVVMYGLCVYMRYVDCVRVGNQSIERDRLIGIGLVMDLVKFLSFTFGGKEMTFVVLASVLVFVEAAKQSVSVTVLLLWIVDSERDRLIVIVVCPAMLCFTYHSDFQSELLACLKPMTLTNIMLTFKHHFQAVLIGLAVLTDIAALEEFCPAVLSVLRPDFIKTALGTRFLFG
ncbi:hypothetical protein Tco_0709633 [Tanacetum coccineum]